MLLSLVATIKSAVKCLIFRRIYLFLVLWNLAESDVAHGTKRLPTSSLDLVNCLHQDTSKIEGVELVLESLLHGLC